MIVLAYLGCQCAKFHTAGWMFDFLRPFIWSHVSGLMHFRDGSDSECTLSFTQTSEKCDGDPGND
jgi:hypothetical protein